MSLWKSHDVYTIIQDSLDGDTISDEDDCTVDYFMNCDFVTDDGSPYLILTIQEEAQGGTAVNNKFKISVECVADADEKPMNKFVEKPMKVVKEYYENEADTTYENFINEMASGITAAMRDIKVGVFCL